MHWAWNHRLQPSAKVLLLALADIADDQGFCWPSNRTLAEKCCTSERTVQRMLKQFEDLGLITIERRFTEAGRQTSNGYRLALGRTPDNLSPSTASCRGEGDNSDTPGVTQLCHPRGVIAVSPLEPPHNHHKEPPLQPQGTTNRKSLEIPPSVKAAEKSAIEQLLTEIPGTHAQELLDELAYALENRRIHGSAVAWFAGLVRRAKAGLFSPVGAHVIDARRRTQTAVKDQHPKAEHPSDTDTAQHYLAGLQKIVSKRAGHGGLR